MRRYAIWSARLAAALALFCLLGLAALSTTIGQRQVLAIAEYVMASADGGLTFGKLEGSLLSEGRISHIAVRDRDGDWLQISDVSFSWHPFALIRGHLEIDYLTAGTVDALRKPRSSQEQPNSSPASGSSIIALAARRLEINEIVLREATGASARLRLSGRADLIDPTLGLSALINITRLDEPGGALQARLSYHPEDRTLDVVATASEPARGLVSDLLGLPGAPPLSFSFNGSGVLDSWRAHWSMTAADQPFAAGTIRIDQAGQRHRLDARFEGYLQPFLPPALSGILAGKTTGVIEGAWTGFDRFDAERVSLISDALRLTASGGYEPDRGYAFGRLDARVARDDGQSVVLALQPDASMSIRALDVHVSLPDTTAPRRVDAAILAEAISGSWGTLDRLEIAGAGIQQKPASGSVPAIDQVDLRIATHGVHLQTPGLSDLIGPNPEVRLTGSVSSLSQVKIDGLRVVAAGGVVRGRGTFAGGVLSGTAEVEAPDLAKASALAGQPLGGRLALQSDMSFTPGSGSFSIALDARGQDLMAIDQRFARILSGTTRLSGHVEGATSGKLLIKDLALVAAGLNGKVQGQIDGAKVNVDFEAQLSDLSAIDPAMAGSALLVAELQGSREDFATRISLKGQQVTLHGRPVTAPMATFKGRGSFASHAGTLDIAAQLAQRSLSGHGNISLALDGATAIEGLEISFGAMKAEGSIRTTGGTPTGRLSLEAPSLADLSVIVGRRVEGAVAAKLEFSETAGVPAIAFQGRAARVRYGDVRLSGLEARGTVLNYLAAVRVNAELRLQEYAAEGLTVSDVRLGARDSDGAVRFTGAANVNGAHLSAGGTLAQRGKAFDVEIIEAALSKDAHALRLKAPAQISIADGNVKIQRLAIASGNGAVEIGGEAGSDKLALEIVLKALPAGIANAFVDKLSLDGAIDGRIAVRGTPASPEVDARIAWRNAMSGVMRAQHLPALDIDLNGRLINGTASGVVEVRGPDRMLVTIDGSVASDERGTLNARITGDVPLAAGNGALAARAARLGGRASLVGDVSGTIASPVAAGTIRLVDVTVDDPATGLKLRRGGGLARFTESRISIESFEAASEQGGTLSAGGEILRDSAGSVDIRLALGLSGFKFDDHELLAGEVDGAIEVRGTPAALDVGGTVHIGRLDITIPSQLPRSVADLELKHVNAPAHIRQHESTAAEGREAETMRVGLNVHVGAANRIFVRGRGLDAQLGGDLRLQGTAARPVAVGGFAMERGRLSILGRQLDFGHGNIYFDGSLEPLLDMQASGAAGDVTVIVSVTGTASKPVFRFSSVPELPEDEVVARFLFNKELAGLSPFQLAQLASEIDKIGGLSSGPSMLDQLKSSVGIDVLDVGMDQTGAATVSAGSYVSEKTYIGVRGGTSIDASRVVIDHDLTKHLKARGEVGADNSKIGIGVEWDY